MIEEEQGVEGETGVDQGAGGEGHEQEAGRDQETEEGNDQEVAGGRSRAQDAGTGQDHEIRVNPDQPRRTGPSPNLEVNLCHGISLDLVINLCLGKSQDHGISPGPDQGTRNLDHVTINQDRGTRSLYHGINQDQLINLSPDPGQVVAMTKSPCNSFHSIVMFITPRVLQFL